MIEDDDERDESSNPGSFSGLALNRIVAILFVFGIYVMIFLKILILE